MRNRVKAVLAAGVLFLISGCPNLIDQNAIDEMEDTSSPSITITSPSDGASYTQTVTVAGIAKDPGGQIRRVNYEVAGTLGSLVTGSYKGDQLSEGGDFSFQFSTVSFEGPIVITVDAEDWNDNTASSSINLQYPGSAISSLEATPSNKSIELNWDAVEGASSYTVLLY